MPREETLKSEKKKEKKKETKQTLCVELFGGNAFVKYSFQISFLVLSLAIASKSFSLSPHEIKKSKPLLLKHPRTFTKMLMEIRDPGKLRKLYSIIIRNGL